MPWYIEYTQFKTVLFRLNRIQSWLFRISIISTSNSDLFIDPSESTQPTELNQPTLWLELEREERSELEKWHYSYENREIHKGGYPGKFGLTEFRDSASESNNDDMFVKIKAASNNAISVVPSRSQWRVKWGQSTSRIHATSAANLDGLLNRQQPNSINRALAWRCDGIRFGYFKMGRSCS